MQLEYAHRQSNSHVLSQHPNIPHGEHKHEGPIWNLVWVLTHEEAGTNLPLAASVPSETMWTERQRLQRLAAENTTSGGLEQERGFGRVDTLKRSPVLREIKGPWPYYSSGQECKKLFMESGV